MIFSMSFYIWLLFIVIVHAKCWKIVIVRTIRLIEIFASIHFFIFWIIFSMLFLLLNTFIERNCLFVVHVIRCVISWLMLHINRVGISSHFIVNWRYIFSDKFGLWFWFFICSMAKSLIRDIMLSLWCCRREVVIGWYRISLL